LAAVRSTIGRWPLRVHLVAAMLVLLAAALFGTWLVATEVMQRYLLGQLDTRLDRVVTQSLHTRAHLGPPPFNLTPQPGSYDVELIVNGTRYQLSASSDGGSQPQLSGTPPLDVPFSVPSANGGEVEWRVLVRQLSPGHLLLVASNQGDVDLAIADLSHRFLFIAVGALILLGGAAYALARRGLRPLEEVERTAEEIATGDLSLRVPVRRPGSEVGRLASAFNTMVERIESAFRARERSEASARSSEERMRRFVADASHELRTPLTSIRGYAELYRQGAVTKPDDVAAVLRRIEDQAAQMGLLVEDLLLLARLDQQRPLERAPVDLAVLAVDAVHDAHAMAPDRTVGLRLPPADGEEPAAVPVLGDEARLRQVLGNLVNNALTHTPPGTRVEVRLRAEGAFAQLEVADSGPGLSPEQAERVFERFYRADPARGRVSGGTGLGLAIVAALVAAHGGRVEVDSEVGAGTTFRVLLPLQPYGPPEPDRDRPPTPPQPFAAEPFARRAPHPS
jgi:two-component system OmpR family sensor kinase